MRLYFSSNGRVKETQKYYRLVLNILCVTEIGKSSVTASEAVFMIMLNVANVEGETCPLPAFGDFCRHYSL